MAEHLVSIGACGWAHSQWDEEYYPDDLPREWQLGYYGNEFPVVLIPASAWQQEMSAVQSWLDETDETPAFVCEWPEHETPAADYAKVLDMIRLLGARVWAVLIKLSKPAAPDLLRYLQKLEQDYPLALEVSAEKGSDIVQAVQQVLEHPVSIVWSGEAQRKSVLDNGRLAIARLADQPRTPRELRAILETMLAQQQGKAQLIVLFDGQPPAIEQMRNTGVILDLL